MRKELVGTLFAVILSALSGCGGGSSTGGSSSIPKASFVTLVNLPNGQGVAIGNDLDGGGSALIFSHDISAIVASANKSAETGASGIQNISPANFPIISSTTATTTRRGTLTSDTSALNLTILQNNQFNNISGIYIETPGYSDFLMVVGEKVSSIPVSGSNKYSGTFTQNARSVIAPGEIGSFAITVDFLNRKFSINGSTANMALVGNGSIDLNSGLFASNNINIAVRGMNYTGTLYGILNGASASGVSGVFYTNDLAPDYSGTFFGKK